MLKYGSVCSGIESASVAWLPLGWKAAWLSEIGAFPSAVLAHHYPTVPNLGDMTKFKEWPDAAIDLLVGGTPCQSFSVAGLRKGLADPRGNLMLTYLAIAARFSPRWLVWENVPGVLSSNGGRDFGSFLGGLAELGYGFAYRILDAQYFGVPQRRRRVFVIGYLGDWRRAAAVLFERESLLGHPAPRREAGKGIAAGIARSVALRGREGGGIAELGDEVGLTLRASGGGGDKAHVFDPLQITSPHNHSNPTPGLSHTLPAASQPPVAFGGMRTRRLTPVECERLQAFPDNYTRIPTWPGWRAMDAGETPESCIAEGIEVKQNAKTGKWRVKDVDGPRYKSLGNSMCVNVMAWIGKRIQMVEDLMDDQNESQL